ncbi:MAG: HD domain-containing protein [Lachnospiraceae bacterium]|nr:HD domain-containing protein [Lachnospiraceae bacterium]
MDRKRCRELFDGYVEAYDPQIIEIKLKIDHTYRVAEIAERIAAAAGADTDLAWMLGMFHDIARFEQFTKYGTFKDAVSVDHAELGADILFKTDDSFRGIFGENAAVAETAIRLHNKLDLPEELDEGTLIYCNILRDADKIDIFRVINEPPYDERNRLIASMASPASEEVMDCVLKHRCVPRPLIHNKFEALIGQCCMGFELVYPESIIIAKEQGYLGRLLGLDIRESTMKEQLGKLRTEILREWKIKGISD